MPDTNPKTVQIYLPDGNARSVRIAEITSRTVQATQIPRSKLNTAEDREEIQSVGVYFLFGETDEDAGKPVAYVGEAENCYKRLVWHHRHEDFWNTAITIASKTKRFTKGHARYLEYDCIREAKNADRFRLRNEQIPAEPHVPEPMWAELRDNFGTIRTLLSMLGYPILDPLTTGDDRRLLHCTGRGADGTGEYTEDGLVVFKGSKTSKDVAPSGQNEIPRRYERLIEDGVLKPQDDGHLVFTEDHPFKSPSGAAVILQGQHVNGWEAWTDENGRTLDELERQ